MKIKEVLELIVNITHNSLKCEESKQALNDHLSFEPYSLFSRLDRKDKRYLSKNDFLAFLDDNSIEIDSNRNTIDLFIEYYDRDFDNQLSYSEFLNFILSKEQNLIRSITIQGETNKLSNSEFLEEDLENLTAKLLLCEFYLFEYANVKKLEIFTSGNEKIDLLSLFIEFDCDKDGFISYDDIEKTLLKRKVKICQNEIMSFISLYDEDIDGKLNWNEFLFMILPSPTNYDYDLTELKTLEGKYEEYYSNVKTSSQISQINSQLFSNNSMQTKNQLTLSNTYYYNSNVENTQSVNESANISELASILYKIIDFEKQIENMRYKLTSIPNFNIEALFNFFDQYANDYVSLMDFNEALESLGIVNKNSILIFSRYDMENKGKLSKENFNKIFLPQNIKFSHQGSTILISNSIKMAPETKNAIVQLLETLINYYDFFSTLPKWYEENKNEIDYYYNTLDKDKKGYINENEFALIFDGQISEQDLFLIMELLDSDKDGKITYDDMVKLFK